jgi:integrase
MDKYSSMTIVDLGGGRWQARLRYKEDGVWRRDSRNFEASSKRAARAEGERVRAELERLAAARLAVPVGEDGGPLLLPAFLEAYVRGSEAGGGIEPTTATNYRHAAAHICRYLSLKRVDELTPQDVLAMQEGLLSDGLCPNTVARAHRFLKQAMAYAVDMGVVSRTPFTRQVKPPKRVYREPNALDDATRMRLLAALDATADTELTLAVRLGLSAGLRREEICGLRWRDVDLGRGVVMVRQAITQVGGKTYLKGPKTPKSRRDVPLEPDLARRLSRRLSDVRRACAARDADFSPDLYALGDDRGAFYNPTRLTKEFGALSKALDLRGTTGKRVGLHDLRHTFATYLVAKGTDVKTVSSLMGHANAAMTLNVYASADPDARLAAGRVVAEAMAERPRRDEGPRRPLLRVV